MGPWLIAGLCIVALAGLVAVVRLTRHKGTRAAPRRAAEAIPDIRGSMSLAAERYPFTVALEAAHDDCWADLPGWAHPMAARDDSAGWASGPGGWNGRGTRPRPGVPLDGGGDEWDAWHPEATRLADTGDVMDARLAAAVAAELHRQDADAELFLVGLAERARELAASR